MLLYSLSVLCLLCILYFYIKHNTIHFIASLFYIYSFLFIYVSALYLDINAVYSPELGKYIGGETYSASMLLVYLLLFFIASKIVFTKARTYKIVSLLKNYSHYEYKIFGFDFFTLLSLSLLVFLIAIFLNLFSTPIPLFSGLDRVTYFRSYSGILLLTMMKLINIIGLLLGVLYVYSKGHIFNRRVVLFSFFLFLIILFMIGNKFSTPLRFILFFMLPIAILYTNSSALTNIKKKNIFFFLTGVIVFIIITLTYIKMHFGDRLLFEYLEERLLISQAQLWWDFYNQYFYLNWSIENFYHAYNNTFVEPLYKFKGNQFLLYLMDQTIEAKQLFHRMENGYLYTGAYPAFLVALASPLGSLLIHFLFALIYSYLLYIFFILMSKKYFFTTIMSGYLLISILFIFVTSDFGHLGVYITKILLIFITYIIDELLRKGKYV